MRQKIVFLFHLAVTVAAWFAPFLLDWRLLIPIYGAVMLQFTLFGKCLMNEHHGLAETEHQTFYSDLLEGMGFRPNRKKLKVFVRQILYPVLAATAFVWQWGLENKPLWISW